MYRSVSKCIDMYLHASTQMYRNVSTCLYPNVSKCIYLCLPKCIELYRNVSKCIYLCLPKCIEIYQNLFTHASSVFLEYMAFYVLESKAASAATKIAPLRANPARSCPTATKTAHVHNCSPSELTPREAAPQQRKLPMSTAAALSEFREAASKT